MIAQRKGMHTINKALAIIGIFVIALGLWSVTIQAGTNTITFNDRSFVVANYPYFTYGAITVIAGMALIASGLIYSPQKLAAI